MYGQNGAGQETGNDFRVGGGRKKKSHLIRWSLTFTFLLGFFAHGFLLTHISISHDALFDFYDALSAHQHQIELGRVLEPLYRKLTDSGLLMPWSQGIIAFFWLGLAVFFVCDMFDLSCLTEIFLTAGVMTVNISVTAVAAAYTPWLSADMFALLLAVAGAYSWYLYGKAHLKKYLLFGMLSMLCSMSVYQCYLSVTVVLVILLSIRDVIQNKDAAEVFRDGMAGVFMIAAGGAVYYAFMKLAVRLSGTPLLEGDYDSLTNLWGNREPIVSRLVSCIREEMTHFFTKDENIFPYQIVWTVNLLLICICVCLAVRLARQGRKRFGADKGKWVLLLLLAAVLPFAAYMMRLLNTAVHDLMVYSVWLLYLLPLLLWKWTKEGEEKKLRGCIAVLLGFLILSYIQTDNAVYVKKEVESKATLSLMTQIMAQVEQAEGYVPGETPVTFVGQVSEILQEVPGTEKVKGISGCNKTSAITYPGTYQAYFDNVMLRDVTVVFAEGTAKKEEVLRMPVYPRPGYVKLVDGVAVVRLQ